jgi:hypothetical protein
MPDSISLPPPARWAIVATAVLSALAGAMTLLLPDVLTGPAVTNGNARGTGLIVAVVGVPTLVAAGVAWSRGAWQGAVVALGVLAYLLYNDFAFLFATPFNRLFLLSVATLSVTVLTAALALRAVDPRAIAAHLERLPARAIAGYMWIVVGLNALLWLRAVVTATFADRPGAFLDGSGMTTNPFYVQDLAFWLPGAAIVAAWLWQRRPWGVVLAGAWLVYGLIESIGVATDQWFGTQADPNWPAIASIEGMVLFVALALIGLVPLVAYFRAGRAAPAGEAVSSAVGRPSASPASR